jgi:NIPSNAP
MQRRHFLASSAAAAVGFAVADFSRPLPAAEEASHGGADRLVLEIRKYHFASPEKLEAYGKFLESAAIPAYNRAGVEPVGVFKIAAKENPELKLSDDPIELWLLLPHKSLASAIGFEQRLAKDEAFQQAGREILAAPKSNPAFTRYESALLYAFDEFQKVAPPEKRDARVLEMRTYENPNQERALNKMKMFNSGEIPIFARVGMPGVFFGEAFAGPNLPQLTYMVAHPDLESVAQQWKDFGSDADWKKLNTQAEYKDNVSKIIRVFLRPVAGSQI